MATRRGVDLDGHRIDIEFDRRRIVVNEIRLLVDGVPVDRTRVVYGHSELRTDLDDGTAVVVAVSSGMVGELTRAQARRTDGAWIDLEDTPATA